MKLLSGVLTSALIVVTSGVDAQTTIAATPVPTTTATLVAGPSDMTVLRTGTPVPLKMREHLTTNGKKLKVGQRFQMEVAEDIMLNGVTVIPAGSPAMGEVTDVRNKGMWGKSGHINARVLYATVNGRQIRLSGQLDDKGTTGTAGVVGAIAVIPVAGFFVTGTSANIPIGTPINGFMDEDVPVAFSTTSAAPLVVAVPAAPQTTPAVLTTISTPAK
ncbi:hypothetical protein ASG67_17500 [Sphingomonas sp. Leaf339]|uniref:hypothetical protein n=1 Tax=Sphingomonas sp. Leaf339 TaxID=1736343 RepID=UPI0006F2F690|nr:hypothetical protein [Sphingomonas sp. Leaf339]KQU56915.1 hypothetical protein ASG67_17500 [Sphingomonas sp. Leaf339]